MKLSIITEVETYSIEVSDELELENFKVLCEAETGIKSIDIVVVHNNIVLTDEKKSLKNYGVKDSDLLMVMTKSALIERATRELTQRNSARGSSSTGAGVGSFDFGSIAVPGMRSNSRRQVSSPVADARSAPSTSQGNQDDPAVIRDMLLANPEQLALLKQNNPKLAEAFLSQDLDRFSSILKEQQEAKREKERQRIKLLTADPFDMEAQKLIATEIAQENINANMEAAMEFNPESFGVVHMLYINCKVNGHPVKAFIDSGAQTTIMSQACAERCNIMRLVDNRWAGVAKGVGTQKIIGRVHMGQIQIEGDYLASSFCILEEQPMDMLLGLDMLKRHQMCINLKESELLIGTTGTLTSFLAESELPDCARLTSITEENIRKESGLAAIETEDQQLAKALADSAKEQVEAESTMDVSSDCEVPEDVIDELIQIGFRREDIIEEYKKQNGNKTQTVAALFARNIKFKK